jgi:hypothetical protein
MKGQGPKFWATYALFNEQVIHNKKIFVTVSSRIGLFECAQKHSMLPPFSQSHSSSCSTQRPLSRKICLCVHIKLTEIKARGDPEHAKRSFESARGCMRANERMERRRGRLWTMEFLNVERIVKRQVHA